MEFSFSFFLEGNWTGKRKHIFQNVAFVSPTCKQQQYVMVGYDGRLDMRLGEDKWLRIKHDGEVKEVKANWRSISFSSSIYFFPLSSTHLFRQMPWFSHRHHLLQTLCDFFCHDLNIYIMHMSWNMLNTKTFTFYPEFTVSGVCVWGWLCENVTEDSLRELTKQ